MSVDFPTFLWSCYCSICRKPFHTSHLPLYLVVSHVVSYVVLHVVSQVVSYVVSHVVLHVVSHVVSHVVLHVVSYVVSHVVSHVMSYVVSPCDADECRNPCRRVDVSRETDSWVVNTINADLLSTCKVSRHKQTQTSV